MSTRVDKVLANLKAQGKKAIYIYVTAGAPDIETTIEAVKMAEASGADVIELGMPFSDPMADGPVIQTSSVMALKNGINLEKELELIKEIRKFTQIPLMGMGYFNNMLHYGFEKFVVDFKAAGLDGLIIPDLPHEESEEMREICAANDFILAEFITPGTTPERMKETCTSAKGFIYCVSNNGVTGVKKVDYSQIGKVIDNAREYTDVAFAVGFGIGTPEAAVEAAAHADAVIVGSAVVKLIIENKLDEAGKLIKSMREALDKTYSN